jgi:hypothetical protein
MQKNCVRGTLPRQRPIQNVQYEEAHSHFGSMICRRCQHSIAGMMDRSVSDLSNKLPEQRAALSEGDDCTTWPWGDMYCRRPDDSFHQQILNHTLRIFESSLIFSTNGATEGKVSASKNRNCLQKQESTHTVSFRVNRTFCCLSNSSSSMVRTDRSRPFETSTTCVLRLDIVSLRAILFCCLF